MDQWAAERFQVALSAVDDDSAELFIEAIPMLVSSVNRLVCSRDDIAELIGGNDTSVVQTNHANHAQFMSSQFYLRSAQTVMQTIDWVYRSYRERGFSERYFPIVLMAWMSTITDTLPRMAAEKITPVYQAMLDCHELFVRRSGIKESEKSAIEPLHPYLEQYLDALLAPDLRGAISLVQKHVKTPADIARWLELVLQPAMYQVGELWARGEITVGQEHIATAITMRVMSVFYPLTLDIPHDKGQVVLAVSPMELHEVGARMLADLLEMHGWDVTYSGADTPFASITDLIENPEVRALLVSTTLSSNLMAVRDLISNVREIRPELPVVVGGQAYRLDPTMAASVGADASAETADEAALFLDSTV